MRALCLQMGGCAPPPSGNPPAVLSHVQACLTAYESFLKPTMHNMSLIETPPFTMRAVCLLMGGLAPPSPPLVQAVFASM